MKIHLSLTACLAPAALLAQITLSYDPNVQLVVDGVNLPMRWAGGLNFPHVSDIDLDADGDKDILAFDKSGNKVVTLLNDGIAGQVSYSFTHAYDHVYPFDQLKEWVLLRDYNGDGKEDIFGYSLGGFAVYKNTSDGSALSFELIEDLVYSNYVPTQANLYVTQVDVPGIEDIDGDGDLDVITFSIFGNYEEFHKNMSMELYGTADSLEFEVRNRCWGFFSENLNNNSVELDQACSGNVPNPQFPLEIIHATNALRSAHHQPHGEEAESSRAHVGSTTLPLDLDGDGDKDLLLGDVLFTNLCALYNGGDIDSAYMVSQDSLFPVYDVPCDLNIFPASFYEDVDNDARRDLIVTGNYPGLTENHHGILRYKNNGTDAAPIFNLQQNDLFQENMFDVGEGAYPVPFDFDGDGLMDIVVSNYGYYDEGGTYPSMIAALRNTGTAIDPSFALEDPDWMSLSTSGVGNNMYPAFGDMDGDGDKDMYIGDLQGKLHYFENTAVGPVADFELAEPTINHLVNDTDTISIDVGMFASPQLFDVDGDGILDLLIGERNGNVNYYKMLAGPPDQLWKLENDSIGGLDVAEWWNVTGYSVPFMYLNETGQREMVVGSEQGWVHHFDGIEGNVNGTWNLTDSTWQDIREGERTSMVLYDFDGDSYLDAVIGNYRGGISYWHNDFHDAMEEAAGFTSDQAFGLVPNPSNSGTVITLNIPIAREMRLDVLNELGQVISSRRITDRRVELDTRGLEQGVYLVRVSNGSQRWTQRLVVVR